MSKNTPSGRFSTDSAGRRTVPVWLMIMACILALLAVGSGLFTIVRFSGPSSVSRSGTPGVSSPAVTPLQNLSASQRYQHVTRLLPSLADPLDGSQPALWDEGPGCQFRQQALSLTASPAVPTVICFLRNIFVQNFAFQVQVTFGPTTTQGEQQGCALLFRTHLVQQEGFAFNLNSYSRIDPLTGSVTTIQNASLDILAPGGLSELKSWNQGLPAHLDTPNTLTVIAIGSQITLYINGQVQLTISNARFQAGQIGLVSNSSFDVFQSTFAVAFRQMKLWTL
jgi:hypothetical protein